MNTEILRQKIEECGVHEVLGPFGNGWGIEQNAQEFAEFWASLDPVPRTVLEIGTGYKGGLSRFMASILGCQVTTVDIHRYGATLMKVPKVKYIVLPSPGDQLAFAGETEYELVFIDADHTYESVKRDYEWYAQFGKIVSIHDIAGLRACEGVARFWKEISRTSRGRLRKGFHEVVADGPQAAGIGWLRK